MTRFRFLAPALPLNRKRLGWTAGLAALAVLTFSAAPAHAQIVTVTDLTPNAIAYATGVSGNTQVGQVDYHAVLWHGTAASVVDLNPAGFSDSQALGVSGNSQVGSVDPGYFHYAFLWQGTAGSAVNLHPERFDASQAYAVSGNSQVGVGFSVRIIDEDGEDYVEYSDYHALLWHGTAQSVVDLSQDNENDYYAVGVSGDTQVGNRNGSAVLWHGTADSMVSLNPSGFYESFALGVDGGTQVGYGFPNGSPAHALLWHGIAASAVDLHPARFTTSEALGVSGDAQVGYGYNSATGGHALLWRGTAGSAVDLSVFLPAAYQNAQAESVSGSNGVYDVVGTGQDSNFRQRAFLWHVVFASKPTVAHLYPASRTVGRDTFTLTVAGSGFTAASKVQWNGAAQPTTFVNAVTLTASIPASLIGTAGTVQVTVNTPGVGTSNSHTETIMPRPTLSSLSPASKKAGTGAFTLTVTGTGFRPASFYSPTIVKWNGTELATTFVSETKMTAQVPASLIAHAGTAQVVVTTPQVATSESKTFTITP